MADKDEIVKQTVARLQSIQTLDDFKTAREDLIDLMEKIFRSAIEALKAFFENMLSMTPEEQQTESMKFQDENYLLSPEIMKEFDRLDSLPGCHEYASTFSAEMEKRMGPYMEEFNEQMDKLMTSFMGGLMGGMAEAMSAGMNEDKIGDKIEDKDHFEFDYDNPDTPVMLYNLYAARSLDDLAANKDNLIETVEQQIDSDIWDLEVLTSTPCEECHDEDQARIAGIRKRMERFVPETDKEFARIAAMPDAAGAAGKIKKEMMDRLAPKIKELNGNLAKIKK